MSALHSSRVLCLEKYLVFPFCKFPILCHGLMIAPHPASLPSLSVSLHRSESLAFSTRGRLGDMVTMAAALVQRSLGFPDPPETARSRVFLGGLRGLCTSMSE